MNKPIVFDLDGTLITCRDKQVSLFNQACNHYGKDVDVDYYWKLKRNGYSNRSILTSLNFKFDEVDRICSYWNNHIEDPRWLSLDELYNYTLDKLREISLERKIYVLTARKNESNVTTQCDGLGISTFLTDLIVVSHDNVVENKNRVLNKIKASLFIGDTETDFFASQNTPSKFIAFTEGQRSKSFLLRQGVTNFSKINLL
ncbi:hypothetical protein SE23_17240 [Vibrio sinaloensis]|uniref:HAD family hydrolase n=1 Tax=Photobacterium sp. (strain ATCC 43367) TaxID=379097 RepID=UPI000583D72B|nr:HAD hydrolase-like protein [Vibrio sinaloensis]KIE19462.1 hypothetical protein SE23_17240 [Vibrio sinaloensis]